MSDSVSLLGCQGILMLLDYIILIISNRSAAYDTCLRSSVHNLLIYVEHGLILFNQLALFYPGINQFLSLVVNTICICICFRTKVGLGSVYSKERIGVIPNHLNCLFSVIYIIWKCRYALLHSKLWHDCRKGFNYCHNLLLNLYCFKYILSFDTYIIKC